MKKKEEENAMLGLLFKPVEQKAKLGEDPGSLVCAFFKKGLCKKGTCPPPVARSPCLTLALLPPVYR
jgi:hypothetical protein